MMFDRATTLKETLINEKFFQTKVILVVLCMILLATVLIEALFIFKPAILEVIKKRAKLQTLNNQLSQRVEKEVAIRREQETILIQKSKEAQVGELINNIAHQWRQPLSILKLYIQTIKFEYENNLLTKDIVEDLTSKSTETIDHMSQTIDDFRSFFLPSKEDKVFKVGDSLRKVEKLLEHMFLFEKINIDNKYESGAINKSYVFGKGNDLEHCLMILLTNAKDAIVKRREGNINKRRWWRNPDRYKEKYISTILYYQRG
jgi:signal transduction histidine kinase